MSLQIRAEEPLARYTTLEVGGAARHFVEVRDEPSLRAALAWARKEGLRVLVLGGGSNLLIADAGFDGLVIRPCLPGLRFAEEGLVEVGAGVVWDDLVAACVSHGLAGVECLSGIPGLVGAAPIQNIGAYGQEVAEVVESVRAVHRATGEVVELSAQDCGFAYRSSRFKRDRSHVVTSLRLRLRPGGAPTLRYAQLAEQLPAGADLAEVRRTVLAIRAQKSMVLRADDPNRRSAGSFFLNPVVEPEELDRIEAKAPPNMPRWPQQEGRVKLSAAWLIERAGLPRGYGEGRVGLSTKHTLAVVNRGGASAAEVIDFAEHVQRAVEARFGVKLMPEPIFVGFEDSLEAAQCV